MVFAVSWRKWSGARIMETIANFHLRPDQTVLVIGRKFRLCQSARPAAARPDRLPGLRNKVYPEHLETNAEMEQVVDPPFSSIPAILCGRAIPARSSRPRASSSPSTARISRRPGRKYVGSLLFRDPRLAPLRAPGQASL